MTSPTATEDAETEWHRVTFSRFVPPTIQTRFSGEGETGVVTEDGRVKLDDDYLTFADGCPYGADRRVTVRLRGGDLYARSEEGERRAKEAQQEARERRVLDKRSRSEKRRAEAAEFWDGYDIPFEWDTAIKPRRSGLLRGSAGTGHDAATVVHLHVKEAFCEGQLSRESGSYLCENGSTVDPNGTEERHSANGEEYVPKVTCKLCLDLLERWEVER